MLAANGNLSGLLERKELKHGAWGKIIGNNLRQDASGTYAGYETHSCPVKTRTDSIGC